MRGISPFLFVKLVQQRRTQNHAKPAHKVRRSSGQPFIGTTRSAGVVVVVVVVSHTQRIGCQPEKLLYTVANPARGLPNREKRTKEKSGSIPPPPTPHTARSEKINKITRRIYRPYAGLGRSRVRTRIPSARRLGLWVWLRKILHSRLQ